MKKSILYLRRLTCRMLCTCALVAVVSTSFAQVPAKYSFKNGRMYIELDRKISQAMLDTFVAKFNLFDIPLKNFTTKNIADSLVKLGWNIDLNSDQKFIISKSLGSVDHLDNPAEKIIFAGKHQDWSALFPVVSSSVRYGYNRFKNKSPFAANDSFVTFYLKNYLDAQRVNLAGSFNNWQPDILRMSRTDSGWIATVKLTAGKYWYKFIVNGNWLIDTDNLLKENDGLGNDNSVYYKTNYVFRVDGYTNKKRIYLSGNFNNWKANELLMYKSNAGWFLPIYLPQGTHTYRFVVDGEWIYDPKNPNRLPNEYNSYNSVVQLGKQHTFRLAGYHDAKQVVLSGSFNGWRDNELYMNKIASGWELPYVLGPGNYEYRFLVDKKWTPDPANPPILSKSYNSYLIIEPNYTFRLKGYANASSVFLAGDFNDWSRNSFPMKKVGGEWIFQAHLATGKYRYKFIIDGNWLIDPANKLWEQNEFGTGNSIIWIDK